jgi:hypothetical protein
VVEGLGNTHKALGLIPSTAKIINLIKIFYPLKKKKKRNLNPLLVGMQAGATTLEKNLEAS